MAQYATLKAAIDAVIKANGQREITGTVLNQTLNAMVNSLGANYQFAGVATPSTNPGTPDQNVFYLAGQGGTYTNFNNIAIPNGISFLLWNGSWSSQTVLSRDGGVFDISAYKATGGTLATFADLSAALGENGENVPIKFGGMQVRFVSSSDNKYVQARCMARNFTTDVTQWQGVDDTPTPGSNNLVKSGGVVNLCKGWSIDNGAVNNMILEIYAPNVDFAQLAYIQVNLIYYTGSKYYNAIYARRSDDSLLAIICEFSFDTLEECVANLQTGQIIEIGSSNKRYILFSGKVQPITARTSKMLPINNLKYFPRISNYLAESEPVENSDKPFTSGGAYAIKQTILNASQNTTTGGINLNLGTSTVANIAKEEDLLSQDFGRNIINIPALSNANVTIGESLKLNEKYYIKFTLSTETSVSILLRNSAAEIVQTILSGVTLKSGTYIIPFICTDISATMFRVGNSQTFSNYTNILVCENKTLTLMTLDGWCDNNIINEVIHEFYYPLVNISEVTSIDIRVAYYQSSNQKWYNAVYIRRGESTTINALNESFATKQEALNAMPKGIRAIENGGQLFIKQPPTDTVVMTIHYIKDFSQLNNMPIIALSRKLAGKSVIWEGDSIAADNEGNFTGWRTRIETLFGVLGTNFSRGGSTFTANLDGLSTDYNISLRIDNELSNPVTYLIMDGGTNDADRIGLAVQWNGDNIVPKASLPAAFGSWNIYDFTGPFDKDTFCGAVEYTIKKILTTMRGVKLGYVLAPKMGIMNHVDTAGRIPFNRKYYMDTVAAICKKWGVPVLDLWDDCWLNPNLTQHYDPSKTKQENIDAGNYYLDGQHLTGKGYDYISPLIAEWMLKL